MDPKKSIKEDLDDLQVLFNAKNLSRSDQMQLIDAYKRKLHDKDYDYIRCVLFPEIVNPQRVPTQFGIPSALFTHRFHVYISTGLNGNGVIQLAPKDTTFCCLAVSDPAVAYSGNPTNQVIQMQYL